MGEMEKYRARVYRDRRTRTRRGKGRRLKDYKVPSFWTVGAVAQFITLILMGLCMIVLSGCAYIKRNFLGG